MTFNPFTIIRNAARNAFMKGVMDAVEELAPPDYAQPFALDDVQPKLALQSPDESKRRKEKLN